MKNKSKKILKGIAVFLGVIIVAALGLIYVYGPTVGARFGKPLYLFPPSEERYVKVSLDLMESEGYYATGEKWETQKEKALKQAKEISSYEEAHPIIEESLKVAGGKHSGLLSPDEIKELNEKDEAPTVERQGDIAIIHLPALMDATAHGQEYAEIPLKFLEENKDIKGTVIDLQGNTGGDMGPMVTAVSPLLSDGELLNFKSRNYSSSVSLDKGVVSGGGTSITTNVSPFKLDVPVALLLDDNTASSAEALTMCFLDSEQVKTFGHDTAGYASANTTYQLYDNAMMLLTVAFDETPEGKIFYEDPIPVDVETDEPLKEAIQWLQKN